MIKDTDIKLGLVCGVHVVISLVLVFTVDFGLYAWLAWNVFLSMIPLGLSYLADKLKARGNRLMYTVVLVPWLLFFPNAHYMVTNVMHIRWHGFTGIHWNYIEGIAPWFGMIHMTLGIILGIFAGLYSLDRVLCPYLKGSRRGRVLGATALGAVALASGYAIYIGRFLRFNSWDLVRPVYLVRSLVADFDTFALQFSLLFAVYVAASYLVFHFLRRDG